MDTSQIPSLCPVYLLKGVQFSNAGGPESTAKRKQTNPEHPMSLFTFEVGHDLVGLLAQFVSVGPEFVSVQCSGHLCRRYH